jgi:hypothetical protein
LIGIGSIEHQQGDPADDQESDRGENSHDALSKNRMTRIVAPPYVVGAPVQAPLLLWQ